MVFLRQAVRSRSGALTAAALALALAGCEDRGLDEDGADDRASPTLTIETPERASLLEGGDRVIVSGRAADSGGDLERVEVNGEPAALDADGRFTAEVALASGITLLHTVAHDAAGNQARDTRAVLAGELAPLDQPVERAFAGWLSAQAVDAVGDTAAAFAAGEDLGALVGAFNPVLTRGGSCLGARVSVVSIEKSDTRVSLVPRAGSLSLVVELDDLDVPLDVDFDVACVGGGVGARLTATRFTFEAELTAQVTDGTFAVDLASSAARFDGFQLDVGLVPGEIVDLIASDLDQTIADQLTARLDELVVPQLDAALAGLAAGRTFDVLGSQVTVAITPEEVSIEDAGVRIVLDASMTAAGDGGAPLPGYLSTQGALPELGSEDGFDLAVADDAANQALAAFTAAGGLDQELPLGGGEYGEVGELFDRVRIAAPLPPVVTATSDGLVLTAGDLRVDFEKDEAGGAVSTTSIALSASARVNLVVTDSGAVRLAVDEPVIHADFEEAAGANSLAEPEIERLASFAGGRALGAVGSLIGEVPLPSVLGLTVADLSVTTAEDGSGYLVARGQLVAP